MKHFKPTKCVFEDPFGQISDFGVDFVLLKEGPRLGYYEVKSRMNGSDRSFQNLGGKKNRKISAIKRNNKENGIF